MPSSHSIEDRSVRRFGMTFLLGVRHTITMVLMFFSLLKLANGGRILAYIVLPSYSHQVVFRPLWRELSLRGHNVTLLTTDPMNDSTLTNVTEIDLSSSKEILSRGISRIVNSKVNTFTAWRILANAHMESLSNQMEHPFVQRMLTDKSFEFDILLLENMAAPPVAFAKLFGCPLVGMTTLPAIELLNNFMGVPTNPTVYPDVLLPFDKAETLLERLISAIYYVFMTLITDQLFKPIQNAAIEKYFGKGYGTMMEHVANTSLMIVNTNPILSHPRPTVPSIIQVGGIHRVPPKPLPEQLQTILDSAIDGFIYFSLGSNVKSKEMPLEKREVLLKAFSELPYKVLWKFELDHLPNKPQNVIISKWFPQTDILRHPNIKLFITQGGLQSMEEAIYEGVPMVGMPVFADQPGNVQKMVRKGFGLSVDIERLEKDYLKNTILEVIKNPRYGAKVREISRLALDQPMDGLEQAVWWIEYVMRHKGAKHLTSPLKHVSWSHYFLLDVLVCLIAGVTALLCMVFIISRVIIRHIKKIFKLFYINNLS